MSAWLKIATWKLLSSLHCVSCIGQCDNMRRGCGALNKIDVGSTFGTYLARFSICSFKKKRLLFAPTATESNTEHYVQYQTYPNPDCSHSQPCHTHYIRSTLKKTQKPFLVSWSMLPRTASSEEDLTPTTWSQLHKTSNAAAELWQGMVYFFWLSQATYRKDVPMTSTQGQNNDWGHALVGWVAECYVTWSVAMIVHFNDNMKNN